MTIVFATRLAAGLVAGAALTAAAADRQPGVMIPAGAGPETAVSAKALGGAVAPNARLAGVFDAGGAAIRTKGVASVQRIATGTYCIRPTAEAGIDVAHAVVTVTAEYYYSFFNAVMAQSAVLGTGCGPARIGVRTLADEADDGVWVLSNSVGFSVVVP